MKLLANKVALQRYTPPTCTLEVRETQLRFGSQDSTASKETRFSLHFDDPRLPEDKQISMEGDQDQLKRLCEVVNHYVQHFLGQTFLQKLETSSETILFAPSDSLSLSSKSLLTHVFCFGLLESFSLPNPMMELSSSQLFDLANALETYEENARAQASSQSLAPQKNFWDWSGIALIGLVAIGLTGIGLKIFQANQQVESLTQTPPLKTQFNFTDVLSPIPPAPTNKPLPNPRLASALAIRDPLPAPSTVQPAIAPVRNPTVNLAIPVLRVLPPNPIVPPAPPSVAIATSSNSVGTSMMIISAPNQAPLPILPPENPSRIGLTGSTLPTPPVLPPLIAPQSQALPPQAISSTSPISNNTQYNLLDAIPQVAETREYFQKRWQPPDDLTQTLEYRLLIKPDGSLAQSIPLGKAASLYLVKLPMPNPGTPFVSPLTVEGEQILRLVLSPNGNVKTFLE